MVVKQLCLALLIAMGMSDVSFAQTVDFGRDVYPVLEKSCFECHGSVKQEAGLRLDSKSELLGSGSVKVRSPDESELVRRIELPRNHKEVMPLIGAPLTHQEVESIREWIASGAHWPDDFVPPPHWAYVQPVVATLPQIIDAQWSVHPIDRFVKAKLDELGMQPSPRAEPSVLLRRLYFDLIGLPPTLKEIEEFEADQSSDALVNVIDELLARPQFGERWARPWLDLARYADSHGFQRDDFRDLWAYRDWVIRAINDDMPFDQFTIEQLAGDLLPNPTPEQRIATGFHRCCPTNVEAGSLPEETRIEQVIDRVNTTASVWLGSTLECAQCHDHKFDPFSMKDYYRLLAFFNQTKIEADLSNANSPSSIAFIGASMSLPNKTLDEARQSLTAERLSLLRKKTARRDELAKDIEHWAHELRESISKSAQSHKLEVLDFQSTGNTDSYQIRDDGAVLLVGNDPPSTDNYIVTAKLTAKDVRAIRLDVLTDPRLPGTGPGRGDSKRTNFVLNEFAVSIAYDDGKRERLEFSLAEADFSQSNYEVRGAIDRDEKTGWAIAPQFSKPHWATFSFREPLDASAGVTLEIRLDQRFGGARSIGCFKLSGISGDIRTTPVPENVIKTIEKGISNWTEEQMASLMDYRSSLDSMILPLDKKIGKIDEQLRVSTADTTQVMVELDAPRETFVFDRGNYRSPGEKVSAGTPESLHVMELGDAKRLPNRLDFARWLVSSSNPLVARVTVNRWWAELFGNGLVRTPEDFGLKGDRPTHPELLDYLAVDFMKNGWSMKQLLREIVMSETYQQSSATSKELLERDDQNRFLARGPRVRLDAEMIRDNSLAISGLLSLKSFGPPIRPYQPDGLWAKVGGQKYDYVVSPGEEKYRRGIYVVIKRGAPYPSFVNFDANNRFACTVQRSRTNTPLQALTLLNDPVYVEAAKAIAVRAARTSVEKSVETTLIDEYRRCTARTPDAKEVEVLARLYQSQLGAQRLAPDRSRRLASDVTLPNGVREEEFAAWYSVATVMLNLHETITKE